MRTIPLYAQGILLLWLTIDQSEQVDQLEDKPIELIHTRNGETKTIIINRPEPKEIVEHVD